MQMQHSYKVVLRPSLRSRQNFPLRERLQEFRFHDKAHALKWSRLSWLLKSIYNCRVWVQWSLQIFIRLSSSTKIVLLNNIKEVTWITSSLPYLYGLLFFFPWLQSFKFFFCPRSLFCYQYLNTLYFLIWRMACSWCCNWDIGQYLRRYFFRHFYQTFQYSVSKQCTY